MSEEGQTREGETGGEKTGERSGIPIVLAIGILLSLSAVTVAVGVPPGPASNAAAERVDGGVPDTDGDRLPDRWEVLDESPDGTRLPDANPLRKDLYVQVGYDDRIPPLTASERRQLRRAFARMPVGESGEGIRLHLDVDPPHGGAISDRVTIDGSETREELRDRFYARDRLGPRRCVYHLVVLGVVTDGDTVGYGDAPGYLAVVDGTRTRTEAGNVSLRVRSIVHELLHNLVGEFDDGTYHTDRGWLSHDGGGEAGLSGRTTGRLARDGFPESAHYRDRICR